MLCHCGIPFPKGFASWWCVRPVQSQSPHLQIPLCPPDFQEATLIRDAFQLEVNAFEAILKQSIATAETKKHSQNANQVFPDVRKPEPVPAQVLVAKVSLTVAEVVGSLTICVEQSNESVALNSDDPVQCHWEHLCSVDNSTVTFTQEHGLQVGDVLTQSDLMATPQELHAFESQWPKRWDKHASLIY